MSNRNILATDKTFELLAFIYNGIATS